MPKVLCSTSKSISPTDETKSPLQITYNKNACICIWIIKYVPFNSMNICGHAVHPCRAFTCWGGVKGSQSHEPTPSCHILITHRAARRLRMLIRARSLSKLLNWDGVFCTTLCKMYIFLIIYGKCADYQNMVGNIK